MPGQELREMAIEQVNGGRSGFLPLLTTSGQDPTGTTWVTHTAEHPAEILSLPQQLQEADPGGPGLKETLANLEFLADPWYTSWHSHTAELFRFTSKRVRTSCIVHSKF